MDVMGTTSYSAKATAISRATPIVFVVDDDSSVRASLDRLIRSASWKSQTFGSAQEFLDHPRACTPNCLVLDVSLPGLNGLELQQQITADGVETPIIFITGHHDVRMSVRAMKAGAVDFLTKPFNDNELLGAIAQAIERSEVNLGTETETRSLRDRYEALSNREREVMDLIVAGKLNKQVGGDLGISEITVKGHRGRVMRKMQARSFAALVKMAVQIRSQH